VKNQALAATETSPMQRRTLCPLTSRDCPDVTTFKESFNFIFKKTKSAMKVRALHGVQTQENQDATRMNANIASSNCLSELRHGMGD
jgi:hypothetical protein